MPIRLCVPRRPAPAANDDRSLLARFAGAGDQAAFAALVDRHGPLVLGVCRRVLRDPHLADDAFQAVFLVLARKAGAVQVGPSLASWLFGVARRVSLVARRRRFRMRNAELGMRNADPSSVPHSEIRTPHSADWDDLLRVLDEELARLPDKLRAPVLECFFREKTQDEAAKALGWSLSTLRRRLDRAKELLRSRLTSRGATLTAALLAGAFAASTALASVPAPLAQAAVGVAVTARGGGAVAASVASLAKGGMGMSLGAKLGLGSLAAGLAIVGAGVGVAKWSPAPARPTPEPATPAAAVPEKPQPPAKPADQPKTAEQPKSADPPKPVERPKPPGSAQPTAPAGEWVTIRGRVIWPEKLPLPTPKVIEAIADKSHCESQGVVSFQDLVVSPKTRGVKNVVVWLRPDSADRRAVFPKDRINPELAAAGPVNHVIDQPCCQFVPRVVAARVGDTLEFRNGAPVNHNINYSSDAEPFNVNLPPGGSKKTEPLAAQSSPIVFKCDIHPWMQGRVRVFDHPYFAVTDENGNFEIKGAPPGRWRIVYWHEDGFHKGREGAAGFPIEAARGSDLELKPVELELPR